MYPLDTGSAEHNVSSVPLEHDVNSSCVMRTIILSLESLSRS